MPSLRRHLLGQGEPGARPDPLPVEKPGRLEALQARGADRRDEIACRYDPFGEPADQLCDLELRLVVLVVAQLGVHVEGGALGLFGPPVVLHPFIAPLRGADRPELSRELPVGDRLEHGVGAQLGGLVDRCVRQTAGHGLLAQ
ncbi:hypothetical protein GCM10009535_50250 [Streptomyces thermocarboxydovorans]|uniref:Uncharacterized protein n=1 Tax=Streptomyces thermocarboxydovorans TaxID=59298 RepID=A0ABN1HRP7_9ACTN